MGFRLRLHFPRILIIGIMEMNACIYVCQVVEVVNILIRSAQLSI